MTIHILLPVHNRAAVTAAFAHALVQQEMQDFHLVLIDDGCTDDTVERVTRVVPQEKLTVLRGDGTLWWAGALQLGYEFLRRSSSGGEDAVLIANDDMSFEPDFLRRGLEVLSEDPRAAIQAVGHDQLTGNVDCGAVVNLVTLRFRGAEMGERPNCLSTRGLLLSARVFLESGGFRPDRLPHYMSDYEFTIRLHRAGAPLRCDDRFHAVVRLELTGQSRYRHDGLKSFIRAAFSNRMKHNPRHVSAFVMMTCPPWIVPLHLLRIWAKFAFHFFRAAVGGTRANPQ